MILLSSRSSKDKGRKKPKELANLPRRPVSGASHIVAKGETLTSIAKRYKVSVKALTKANHIAKEATLQVGQKLVIPSAPGE